jgi:potassium-dependent mechanosensitive channel
MAALTRKASRYVAIAAAILALASVSSGTVCAQKPNFAPAAAKPALNGTPSANSTPSANDAASGSKDAAAPAGPQINGKEIVSRLNRELGIDLEATTTGWQHELDQVESALSGQHLRYSDLNQFRDELLRLRAQLADASGRLQPRLDADKAQMNLLGPAPAAGQPAEPEQTASGRAELNYHLGLLSAGQGAVSAAGLRVDALLNTLQDLRRKNFASVLLQPVPGLYAYETWAKVPQDIPIATHRLRDLIANWWNDLLDTENVEHIAIGALLAALILGFLSSRLVRRLRRLAEAGMPPPFWQRASVAAGVMFFRALPVVGPVIFLYGMLAGTEVLPERIDWLFYLTAQSIVIVVTVAALASAVFAPGAPQWRLVSISDQAAARLCRLVILLAAVYSLTTLLYATTRLAQAPFALTIAVALPSSLLLAGLVVALLRTPIERGEGATPSKLVKPVRIAAWAIVAAIVVCALTGYLPLARFLAQQLVVTGSILAVVYLLLLWVDGFAQGLSDNGTIVGAWLGRAAGLEPARREQLGLPISLSLKFAVLILAVPLIMLQWGYSWPDIHEWYRQLFFGFRIGSTEVTFGALLASVIVFGVGYAAARLFQGWLDAQVLLPAGISGGVRNSIRTGVGYVGILIAGLVAVSYAGFNLSSIAIVAGALSVGIGFGLQNLVNNFVSGLILLAERPIRVGDQVVVGGEEGIVRKISVRSTELETFDRANVLIPNSYFIAEKVKNWTFRNSIRRVALPVGVAYGSDAHQVRDVLLKVARDNSRILTAPEPFVTLDEFAASSLNFTLYAFVGDINIAGGVRTDLAMAVLDAFKEAGIVMPFGQTDVALQKMDWLRDMLAEFASRPVERHAANGSRTTSDAPSIAK